MQYSKFGEVALCGCGTDFSSDSPLVYTTELQQSLLMLSPGGIAMVPPADTPIMQVVGVPGVQAQYDLSSLSSELELPPTVPGTPVQSA